MLTKAFFFAFGLMHGLLILSKKIVRTCDSHAQLLQSFVRFKTVEYNILYIKCMFSETVR